MQTTNQKGIVKLTKAQYNTLVTTGSVTDGAGNTFTYQDGYLYVTDDVEYVSFTEAQVLTPQQQAQARANIGAGSASATLIKINGVDQVLVTFDSDPQTQINGKVPNTRTIAGVDLQDDITQNELLTALNVENGAEVNEVNDIEIDDVSCVTGTTAEIRTINGDYNASTNRLATGSDLSSLVNKTNVANQVYGTDNNGDQTTYDVANASNVGGAIAQYDSSGRLKSATPSIIDDVANKGYVDDVISNPNLLINGDFRVNQRGLSSYTANNKYTVDRWMRTEPQGSGGTVTVNNDNTITLTTNAGNFLTLSQYIEDYNKLLGKKVALTVSHSNGVVTKITGTLPTSWANTDTVYATTEGTAYIMELYYSATGSLEFRFTAKSSQTITIKYCKLEIGSATQFYPRLYAEELALCQRYYCKYLATNAYHTFSVGYIKSPSQAHTFFPFKVTMRTTPTMTYFGNLVGNYSQGSISPDSIASDQASKDAINILINATFNSQYVGQGIFLRPNNDASAYIEADAEIY